MVDPETVLDEIDHAQDLVLGRTPERLLDEILLDDEQDAGHVQLYHLVHPETLLAEIDAQDLGLGGSPESLHEILVDNEQDVEHVQLVLAAGAARHGRRSSAATAPRAWRSGLQ